MREVKNYKEIIKIIIAALLRGKIFYKKLYLFLEISINRSQILKIDIILNTSIILFKF